MIQDNTTKWKVRKFTDFASNQAMPLGYVHWSISPIVPAGELPLLGGAYDRSLYADLWSWANENGLVISESEWQANVLADGECDKFSEGNGSTTFRVPKLPTTIASDVPSEVPVVGNGMTVGLMGKNSSGQDVYAGLARENSNYPLTAYKQHYGDPYGVPNNEAAAEFVTSLGITTDSTKSGIVAQTSATKITGQWLIVAFGAANNIGNADVANVMQAVEQVQTSVGTLEQGVGTAVDYIVESYRNGTEWYEVYKSGKVRQGGRVTLADTGSTVDHTITFLRTMPRSNYHVNALQVGASGSIGSGNIGTKTQTATNMVLQQTAMSSGYINWEVEG